MAEAIADVIRAKRFELVDAEGIVRAALVIHEDGTAGVDLSDASGQVRASLTLAADGVPRLNLLGRTGGVRAALGFGTDWRTQLVLSDKNAQVIWSAP
jgi:hypothetical protein